MKRKSLLAYVAESAVGTDYFTGRRTFNPRTVLYSHVGCSGVYVISDRDRRVALLQRHYDEHQCPGGISRCEVGSALFENLHPSDQVVVG